MSNFRNFIEVKDNGLAALQTAWNKYKFELDNGTEAKAAGWKKKVDALGKKVLKIDPDARTSSGDLWSKRLNEDVIEEAGKQEVVIWGVAKGKKDEEILFTKELTPQETKNVIKILGDKYGCTKMRTQIIDLSKKYDGSDFAKAVR